MKLTLLATVFAQVLFIVNFTPAKSSPSSLTYVLQADSFAKPKAKAITNLAACDRDWIVIDAAYSGDERWTATDLNDIRKGKAGRKIISYLSIGEAENYRPYWDKSWDTNPPAFLLEENPNWEGNYRVKYWQANWQKLILADVDKITAVGFDGVYLDIVDGFEAFEQDGDDFIDDRINPETKQSYRRDMVDWVKTVAARARKTNPVALVIPQNGLQLLEHADFLKVVDGAGAESVFTDEDKLQKSADTKYVLSFLKLLTAAQKPVFDVEYPTTSKLKTEVQNKAKKEGFVWLVTDLGLRTLGTSGK